MADASDVIYAVIIAGFTAGLFAHIQFITVTMSPILHQLC